MKDIISRNADSSLTEQLKEQYKSEVAGYDPQKYREEISQQAGTYGVKYSDFSLNDFGAERPGQKATIWIIAGTLLTIIAGIIIYKRKKKKK